MEMASILRFSEASNLAVHACATLLASGGGTLTHRRIASMLGVSESHLGKVMQQLVKCGILSSVRGAAGGFRLEADPGMITILDIINCMNGPGDAPGCLLGRPVCADGRCALSDLSRQVAEIVTSRLGSTTLDEFVNGKPLGGGRES
jgi:Rrf2 family transcriptional regulator, nitric oxide-sensitive transcriptional repressor